MSAPADRLDLDAIARAAKLGASAPGESLALCRELRAERARLQRLREFVAHRTNCTYRPARKRERFVALAVSAVSCSCGLAALLAETADK